jgi:hypothetical protein
VTKPHKYKAIPTVVGGVRFDSKKEARRYQDLQLMVKAKVITDLELQPVFLIHALNGKKVATYRGDFRYFDVEQQAVIIEDVKGVKTPVYRLKKKLVEAEHGVSITEV